MTYVSFLLMCALSLQSPTLRHFSSADPLRTYENRSNNHMRHLNKLAPKRLGYSLNSSCALSL